MSGEGAALRRRVTELGGTLRKLGLPVGVDAQALALRALADVGVTDGEDVRLSLRSIYARTRRAQAVFDEIYPLWLRGERLSPEPESPGQAAGGMEIGSAETGGEARATSTAREAGGEETRPVPRSHYSPFAAQGPTGALPPAQQGMAEAMRDAAGFLAALRMGEGRRKRPGRRGDVDLRRSLRRAHATAGEIVHLRRRRRRLRPPRVVLLCDLSRSMSGDDRKVLRLAQAMVRQSGRTEVFAFSTEIRRITDRLRRREGAAALRNLGFAYGGGTRIGFALHRFTADWGRRLLGERSIVVVVSDGLDTGEPALLRGALAGLRSSVRYLFWLSPLAGTPGFEPVQSGVRLALPYCDGFGDALDPRALTKLVYSLKGRRPS